MIEVTLHRRLSETSIPVIGHLDGVPYDRIRTAARSFIYWWRFDDDPDMRPEYLGTKEAGVPLSIPFNTQGRDIRLFQIARTAAGEVSDPLIAEARQIVLHLVDAEVVTYLGDDITYLGDDIIY